MAIPKEPRQLMITIMYLVLTAMLALNVSAEIFNAFKMVDQSLVESNQRLARENNMLPSEIQRLSQNDPANLATYVDRIPETQALSAAIVAFIDTVWFKMVEDGGGWKDGIVGGEPRNYKNKDVTTRYLVNQKLGDTLQLMVEAARDQYVTLFDDADQATRAGGISLDIDDDSWRKPELRKESWADFTFRQMPLAAVKPILEKIKNDAKATENYVLNYLLSKVGGEDIIFDEFQVVSSPTSSYIIRGDRYETEIFLSATSSATEQGIEFFIDGRQVAHQGGVVKYEATSTATGVRSYTVSAKVTNPITGEVIDVAPRTFQYEVGERSVAVSADKMNVFYIGVDNPVSISAAGVPTDQLRINMDGGTISSTGVGKYNVRVTRPGDATITVSGGGLPPTNFQFRVRRIPDPVAMLGNNPSGTMGNGEFRAQGGLVPRLENFDFDARCDVVGFELTRVAARQDPVTAPNRGGTIADQARQLVNQAVPGDTYYFDNVRVRCPGDGEATRRINSLIFRIR